MSTHNIYFRREVRKISILFLLKKKKKKKRTLSVAMDMPLIIYSVPSLFIVITGQKIRCFYL